MSMCPLDCAVPEVRREKLASQDLLWVPLLLYPYKCRSCGTRFHRMPTSVGSTLVLGVLLAALYLGSYAVGKDYQDDYGIVQQIFWPLDWVVGQVQNALVVQR